MSDNAQEIIRQSKAASLIPAGLEIKTTFNPQVLLDQIGSPEARGPLDPEDLTPDQCAGLAMYLKLEGYPLQEIGQILNASIPTVKRWLETVREDAVASIRGVDVGHLAGSIHMTFQHIYTKLMEVANVSEKESIRIQALKAAAELQTRMVALLKELGAIYRAPDREKTDAEIRAQVLNKARRFVAIVLPHLSEEARHEIAPRLREEFGGRPVWDASGRSPGTDLDGSSGLGDGDEAPPDEQGEGAPLLEPEVPD